jgi:adenylate cyclase
VPLALVGKRFERTGRYAFFVFDAALISVMLAFAPLSAGDVISQNFVFLSGRTNYYLVLVGLSILTLSPSLVLWTGLCAMLGLASATGWIAAGMEQVVSFSDLPPSPSREAFFKVVFNPDSLSIGVRVNEGILIAVATGVSALAVHRARGVVRAHAAVEAKRSRAERMFGRYVPTQVAEQLLEGGRLAPELREASVLFADIEGFTGLAEGLPPARVIGLLDNFFGAATAVIDRNGGVIVNHVGDGLIAAFNAPLPAEDHAARAVNAAHALLALALRASSKAIA